MLFAVVGAPEWPILPGFRAATKRHDHSKQHHGGKMDQWRVEISWRSRVINELHNKQPYATASVAKFKFFLEGCEHARIQVTSPDNMKVEDIVWVGKDAGRWDRAPYLQQQIDAAAPTEPETF